MAQSWVQSSTVITIIISITISSSIDITSIIIKITSISVTSISLAHVPSIISITQQQEHIADDSHQTSCSASHRIRYRDRCFPRSEQRTPLF